MVLAHLLRMHEKHGCTDETPCYICRFVRETGDLDKEYGIDPRVFTLRLRQ